MVNSIFYFTLLCICMPSLTTTSNTLRQNVFKRMPSNKYLVVKSSSYSSQLVRSRVQCSALCGRNNFCRYFTYQKSNSKCSLLHSWEDTLDVQSSDDSQTYYSVDEGDIWNMVYFIKSGVNINVSASFSGSGISGCQSLVAMTRMKMVSSTSNTNDECSSYYRSNLIDIWRSLPIAKVKMVIKKQSKVVVSLVLDGRDSTKESWFDIKKVLASPWSVDPENTRLKFTMTKFTFAYQTNKLERAFWMTVVDEVEQGRAPAILFASKEAFTKFDEAEQGDSFIIYVSFESQSTASKDSKKMETNFQPLDSPVNDSPMIYQL